MTTRNARGAAGTTGPRRALPRVAIIGGGKVGRTLGRLWQAAACFAPADVVARSAHSAAAAVAFIGGGRALAAPALPAAADVYLLAVPDRAIADVAAALAAAPNLNPAAIAFHCSGALSSAELAPLAARGLATASVHPALSFADPARAAAQFAGTLCGIEGDAAALAVLEPAFAAIGGRCFAVRAEHKLLYHAGSVFASNFSVVLLDVALRAYRDSGLDAATAQALLAPLVRNAVDNALNLGPARALTGPAARGDVVLVRRQHDCVAQWDALAGEAYRALSELATNLARGDAATAVRPAPSRPTEK